VTGMARKLALTAIAAIAASSAAFSPTVSAQPANPAVPQAFRPCDWVTRQALSDLDIDLAARALLATGEDAVRTILVSSNDVTPQRYTDFLRDVITRFSDR
jgi:hypothetical protein